MNQLGSNFEFLYTFSPYQFLKDDQNNLDTLLNRIELGEFLNLLFTASPPDFDVICNCLKNRHQMNSNYAPLMRAFVVDSASLMNLFLAMEMTNYGDYIPALAARLGFENLNIEDAKEELNRYVYSNNGNGSNLKILFDELYTIDEGFRDCGPSVSNFLFKLHTDQPNKLIELLMVIPDLRDMFYRTASSDGFDCSYSFSHDDMASLMSNNYSELSWNKLIDAFGTNTLLSYFVNNQNSYFMNQAVLYNKSILTNTQQNQNLYGGNYGGLENYFSYIRNYFGQGLYDQITAGFMQQSSVYTDSLRLEEWHLYGSSRIGIYQTNKAMAQRTVRIENGVTTQLSNTHIEQLSLSRFYTERGAKRYELTNHLGNVLTVVTDKKLPVCSGTSVSYFIVDIVSATDYSPFGAPLAERTWQGSKYRFSFNGKENDNEVEGQQDYGFRIYDKRLARFKSIDPITSKYPMLTPFQFASNTPIQAIDLDGLEAFGCTSMLYSESGASIGIGYGYTATISGGTAYDMIGITHFSAYSALNPNNQDIYQYSKNAKIIYGLDINVITTGFNIVKAETFDKAFNKQNGSFPVTKISTKIGFGGGIAISDRSFGLSFGLGLGGTFKTGSQSNILQSISYTYDQAEKIDALGGITTLSKPIAIEENGQLIYQSSILVRKENSLTFVDSGIKVFSKSKEEKDEKTGKISIVPDGQFKTKEYSKEEAKINENGN